MENEPRTGSPSDRLLPNSQIRLVPRWLLGVLGAGMCAALAVGFVLDTKGFAGNLLAELVGVVVGVVVALSLVDRLLRRQREARWRRVRDQTLDAIYDHLLQLAFEVYLELPLGKRQREGGADILESVYRRDITTAQAADEVRQLGELVALSAKELGTPGEEGKEALDVSSTRGLHSSVEPHIIRLRDVIVPRILELADDPVLVEKILEVERAERRWANAIDVIEGWGAPDQLAWEAVAEVLARSATLIRHLPRVAPPELSVPTEDSAT